MHHSCRVKRGRRLAKGSVRDIYAKTGGSPTQRARHRQDTPIKAQRPRPTRTQSISRALDIPISSPPHSHRSHRPPIRRASVATVPLPTPPLASRRAPTSSPHSPHGRRDSKPQESSSESSASKGGSASAAPSKPVASHVVSGGRREGVSATLAHQPCSAAAVPHALDPRES